MKKLLFTLSLIFVVMTFIDAQSAFQRTTRSETSSEFGALSSANNAWLGSGVLYEFGNSDISNHMLISGRMLLELAQVGNLHLPIMSNIELSFEEPINEFNIGLYPWQFVKPNLVAHGGAEFQSDGQLSKTNFKLFVGMELALLNDKGLPLVASVAPVFYILEDDSHFGIEAVVVLPIADGLGLLAQVEHRFQSGFPTLFAFGAVTNIVL